MIKLGPAGIGGMKEVARVLEEYHKKGITVAEIPFTYKIWMTNKEAEEVGKIAKKFDIDLSIHAPYFINLNSAEKIKQEQSKKRILDCCERAHYLNAKYVVFHAGFYGKDDPEKTFQTIKKNILDLMNHIKKWDVNLAPETMGKINVFGSLEDIFRLVKETGCKCCIDFVHLLARSNGKLDYEDTCEKIKKLGHIHSHFSGIEYNSKGEKKHKLTSEHEIEKLGYALKKNGIDNITIINESPNPFGDAIKTIEIFKKLKLI